MARGRGEPTGSPWRARRCCGGFLPHMGCAAAAPSRLNAERAGGGRWRLGVTVAALSEAEWGGGAEGAADLGAAR